ncbi:phosphoglycerate mutase-like protein [Calocera viscosa TUFC12733]|uniref:Phosphoglycerate mutase-like protein n=1 Tax=Calocera viscosa (strain TUFC12733) TaxID=1330018 RepID=A0A167P6Y0_CALVF|nr:phosphoglycerate mutase-like protein [Calocera viscosa TUFC12733]
MTIDPSLYESAPPDLKLAQLHVYVRNGPRAPYELELFGKTLWTKCLASKTLGFPLRSPEDASSSAQAAGLVTVTTEPRGTFDPEKGDFAYHAPLHRSLCEPGELTDVGFTSAGNFGDALRSVYVDRLKFLPRHHPSPNSYYLRAANRPNEQDRFLQTLVRIAYGLWRSNTAPRVHTRYRQDNDLLPNWECSRFNSLHNDWIEQHRNNMAKVLDPYQRTLSGLLMGRWVDPTSDVPDSLVDYVECAKAEGKPYPVTLQDPALMSALKRVVAMRWWGFYTSKEAQKLSIGRLLTDLRLSMARKVNNDDLDPLKLRLFTTGDAVMASSLIAFGIYDGHWIDFNASLTFELFKRSPDTGSIVDSETAHTSDNSGASVNATPAPESAHYVRAIYQNKPLALPACAKPNKHYPGRPELCTFEAFSDVVRAISAKNWWEECQKTGPMPWPEEGLFF